MESQRLFAYNRPRECFLARNVVAGDFSYLAINDCIETLTPDSGAGIWLMPFKGIPPFSIHLPFDLIFLDEDCLVTGTIRSFLTALDSSSCPPAASVLALPANSIDASKTQEGDLLIICGAEEMDWHLKEFSLPGKMSLETDRSVHSDPAPPVDSSHALLGLDDSAGQLELPEIGQTTSDILVEPERKIYVPSTNWLKRWLFPDNRKAPREPVPGLAAYFWTGGLPEAHQIRDLSATGLYVLTDERWVPGTLVRMALTQTDGGLRTPDCSITIVAQAVRWGNDGVGLQLVLRDRRTENWVEPEVFELVSSKQIHQFLKRLKSGDR